MAQPNFLMDMSPRQKAILIVMLAFGMIDHLMTRPPDHADSEVEACIASLLTLGVTDAEIKEVARIGLLLEAEAN